MRQGSAPNFCPPVEEGIVLGFEDEAGERIDLEFLGLIIHRGKRFGFFFPVDDQVSAGSSVEVLVLEVTELDEDDQPSSFELLDDEAIAAEVYAEFKKATADLYDFDD